MELAFGLWLTVKVENRYVPIASALKADSHSYSGTTTVVSIHAVYSVAR